MSKFLKQLFKVRIIHCKKFDFIGYIIFALVSLSIACAMIVFKIPASPEQAGAEPVIDGVFIFMFLFASGFTYWNLFRDNSFYLVGQYKKYEMRGVDSGINQTLELLGSGKFELTIEVIWKVRKEDIPPDQSFRLASSREGNGVKACVRMEIVSDNSLRQFIEFEQYPDERLNADNVGVGKTLDKVAVSCQEKIAIHITAQIGRKEKLAIEHEETFLIRVYNSLNLQEIFQTIPCEISFS